jgi:hypothetical protein
MRNSVFESDFRFDARHWSTLKRATDAAEGRAFSEAPSGTEAASDVLHNAGALGFRGTEGFRAEDPLVALRGRDDFKLRRMEQFFPTEPFIR